MLQNSGSEIGFQYFEVKNFQKTLTIFFLDSNLLKNDLRANVSLTMHWEMKNILRESLGTIWNLGFEKVPSSQIFLKITVPILKRGEHRYFKKPLEKGNLNYKILR